MNIILFAIGAILFAYGIFMEGQPEYNRSKFDRKYGGISFLVAIALIILSFVL